MFIKLKYKILLLAILNINLFSCNSKEHFNGKDYFVLTYTNKPLKLIDTTQSGNIIIFVTMNSCHDCIINLNQYLQSITIRKNFCITILYRTSGKSILERRQLVSIAKTTFPVANRVLFESKLPSQHLTKSIFDLLSINESPALAITDNIEGRIKLYFTYESLFDSNGHIKDGAKVQLISILKQLNS